MLTIRHVIRRLGGNSLHLSYVVDITVAHQRSTAFASEHGKVSVVDNVSAGAPVSQRRCKLKHSFSVVAGNIVEIQVLL